MLFVYRDNELIFGQGIAPDLLPELVSGIRGVANNFYDDEIVYLEKSELSISVYFSHTGVMFLWLCREKGAKLLKRYYELYAKAVVYGDLDLFRTWCGCTSTHA